MSVNLKPSGSAIIAGMKTLSASLNLKPSLSAMLAGKKTLSAVRELEALRVADVRHLGLRVHQLRMNHKAVRMGDRSALLQVADAHAVSHTFPAG